MLSMIGAALLLAALAMLRTRRLARGDGWAGLVLLVVLLLVGAGCIFVGAGIRSNLCKAKGGVYLWHEGKCVRSVEEVP